MAGCLASPWAMRPAWGLALLALPGVTALLEMPQEMPMLALGAGDTHCAPDCPRAVEEALRLGFRHVDTAYEYGTQRAVRAGLAASGLPRGSVWLTTKIPGPVGAERAVALAEQDLKELGTDYVDLLLMHYPCLEGWPDPRDACSAEDGAEERLATWRAMEELLRQGKARHIGVSNFHLRHLRRLMAAPGVRVPFANQVEWHLGWHDEDLLAYCRQRGITLQAYSPLGGGGTTTGHNGGVALDDPVVARIAAEHRRSTAQVALRWSIDKGVAVVTATTQPRHMQSDLEVLDFSLSEGEVAALDALGTVVPSVQIVDDWPDVTLPVVAMTTAGLGDLTSAVLAWSREGGRHVDVETGMEKEVGKPLSAVVAQGVAARDELFVTAKLQGLPGVATRSLVLGDLLPALNTSYVDLLLLQRPCGVHGCEASLDLGKAVESWQAMELLQKQGRARSIGVADFSAQDLMQLLPHVHNVSDWSKTSRVAVNQVEWHLGWHDDALLRFCSSRGITLQAAYPLAGPGSRHPAASLASPAVARAAQRHNVSPAHVALRWALQRGLPLVAPQGAAGESRAELEAFFGIHLSEKEVGDLDNLQPQVLLI